MDWSVLSLVLGCMPFVLLIGMLCMPETPIWLLSHGREIKARSALQRLRGKYMSNTTNSISKLPNILYISRLINMIGISHRSTNIEPEFGRLKTCVERSALQPSIEFREFLKGSVWKPLLISMAIMFFQQFTVLFIFIL